MTKSEHLLTVLSEECAEVSKEVCKALRFGLQDFDPNAKEQVTNEKKIVEEFFQLVAVFEMLANEKIIDPNVVDEERVKYDKKFKVLKYLGYADNAGTLTKD